MAAKGLGLLRRLPHRKHKNSTCASMYHRFVFVTRRTIHHSKSFHQMNARSKTLGLSTHFQEADHFHKGNM